jgi:uncharacterized protein YkwD
VSGRAFDRNVVERAFEAWAGEGPPSSYRRCGVAHGVAGDGTDVVAVVTVSALADLAPLPIRARTGQWLTVEAHLLARAAGGKVLLLGPSGSVRTLPTCFDRGTIRARFALDRPGEFAVQVVAEFESGPRPVIEANVFADVDPPAQFDDAAAPGEGIAEKAGDDDATLLARMLAVARASSGLANLTRDARLDAIALRHALRMTEAHELAHDTGAGGPIDRLRDAGLDATDVGENVARAAALNLAHRELWASPSHRANMLSRSFDRVGLAVAHDDRGETWVVEMFAGGLR